MKVEDFNTLLSELDHNPGREQVMKTALAFLEWMAIKPAKDGKGKLLAPKKEELKKYLIRHPVTNQFQLYKLSAEEEPITVRFAFLKKFRKDQITQLIDKESIVHFQGAPPIIQTLPSAPAYTFHIVAPAEQNRLYIVLNKGDQKRIVSFRKKLTQTQFQKIVPQWQGMGTKSKPEIAEQLWKSLDIKEVNKEFYKQIKEQFDALVGIAKSQSPKTNEEEAKQFAVRLIGRYIFCWFLKEKGIISEILLASSTIQAHKKDFFQKYLYQLFFNTLNEEVPSRNPFKGEGGLEKLYDTIPYLNGGLFEKHPEDKLFGVLDLNAWLVAFVHVLEDFDFTVDESSSQYQQVAIDPEMLGRIFENLLASQNPETEKMANQRKAFGAFYTPREIVDYMVNQALKSYLEEALLPKDESTSVAEEPLVEYKGTLFQDMEPKQTLLNFDPAKKAIADQRRKRLQEHLDKFFSPDCASHPFDKGDLPLVQQKLSEVKILDPACGSGAFPMGVLLRLMELRQLVGHGHRNNYDLKSEILSRNIYGVDIMPMAVEIARLRAWLSLVLEAEYKPQDRKNNFGVSALPNLDFKFVCANSLIDSGYDAFLEKAEHNLTLMRLQGEVQKLERIRDSYFDPKGNKQRKEQLQKEFTDTKNYIKTEFVSLKKNWNLGDFLSKVDDWNPFEDSHPSSFFSPGWMFGIKDGFDVVIGNPPYIRQETADIDRELFQKNFKSFSGKADLYVYFYERGIRLLNQTGAICFITSSKFIVAAYGIPLLQFITENSQIKVVIDFNDLPVFNGITTYPVIFCAKKGATSNYSFDFYSLDELPTNSLEALLQEKKPKPLSKVDFIKSGYKFIDELNFKIVSKLQSDAKPLKKWCGSPIVGIKTGLNEAYVTDKSLPNTKPYVFGRDIKRFQKIGPTKYIIFPYYKDYSLISLKDLGATAKILLKQKDGLSARAIIKEGIGNGTKEWFEYQQINKSVIIEETHIIFPNVSLGPNFSLAKNVAVDMTAFILNSSSRYLLAILNSKVTDYLMKLWGIERRGGYIEYKSQYVEKLPIKDIDENQQARFIDLVDKVLSLKTQGKDSIKLEREIDLLVYKLYNLTHSEVKIVDPDFWLSEEEYDNYKLE